MAIPKATEDTVTSLLAEELQKRGVKTELLAGLHTPAGYRKPDIICKNSGDYAVEAKFSETDLVQAIAKVQNDYIKHCKVLGIEGGFALLYPKELAEPMPSEVVRDRAHKSNFKIVSMFADSRPFRVDEGSIDKIANILSEYILKPTKPIEPTIDFIIKSLRESATYLRNGLRYTAAPDLEGFFGGRGVFENILQYEEKEYPIEELKSAAAFILVNQLLFYQVLSKMRPQFKDIDPDKIRKPSDLKDYFDKVLEVNYRPVFFYDVTSYIPESFVDQVKLIVNVVKGLSVEKVGGDFLGTIFHDLIPFETRKSVAAFYTNVLAAELLASLSIDDPNAQVADLAVGSGGLLVAAYRRKKELLKESFTEAKHRIFVGADLLGIDVMPFAASVAASHLALQSPQYFTNRVRIAVWDSTDLKPGRIIPSAAGLRQVLEGQTYLDSFAPVFKRRVKGAVEIGEGDVSNIQLNSCDVVIMNPPFTRQQRLPMEYKNILFERMAEYKDYLSSLMGYHGYFILLADKFLKKEGKMALVLPATTLNADGFYGIRELLTKKYQIEQIVTTWQRSAFSEAAQFREILLVAKKLDREASDNAFVKITELKKLPRDLDEVHEFARKIRSPVKAEKRGTVYEDESMQISLYPVGELKKSTDNLFKFIAFKDKELTDLWPQIVARSKDKLVKFGEYLDTHGGGPKEGAALGQILKGGGIGALFIHKDISRMLKKEDMWVLGRSTKNSVVAKHKTIDTSISIPLNAVCPTVRRFSGLDVIDVSNELDYLVTDDFSDAQRFLSFSIGKKADVAFFKVWKKYVDNLRGNLLMINHADVSAPGTSAMAYYASPAAAVPRSMWSMRVPDQDAKILSLWLNSTIVLLQMLLYRMETRGAYLWFVANGIKKFEILDVNHLSKKELKNLLQIFDEVRNVKLPSILEQLKKKHPARVAIDKAILNILGFNEKEANQVIDYLYPVLADEIDRLKALMR